jgi:DNA-directed RNA polymerase specialized sigma24 family protein
MKAPSVLTVFRLYCMEELTSDQIARKTGCSKTTVVSRLRLIRKKIGVDPASLRRFSSHLQKIEQDISDSRAEHIHRKRLIYDEGDGEE